MTDRIKVSRLLEMFRDETFPSHSDENVGEVQKILRMGHPLEYVCFLKDLGGKQYEGEPGFLFVFLNPHDKRQRTKLKIPYGPKSQDLVATYDKIYLGRPSSSCGPGVAHRRISKITW